MCQGCVEVLRVDELLLSIYSELCAHSQTITWYSQEGSEVGIDKKAGKGIWRAEGEIFKITSVSNARFRQKK